MGRMARWLLDGALILTNAHFIKEFNQKSLLNCSKVASALICKSDLLETEAGFGFDTTDCLSVCKTTAATIWLTCLIDLLQTPRA